MSHGGRIAQPLPQAEEEYSQGDQATTRRQIEQNFEDVYVHMQGAEEMSSKTSSLAFRRHQFLLMGA